MGKKRILIADDDADILVSMKAILESEGHTVATASDEKGCLDGFKSIKPEIIFLDLMMDSVDSGIKLCKSIRAEDKAARIYLLSAVGDEAAGTLDIQKIGFNGAMSKPVGAAELLEMVK